MIFFDVINITFAYLNFIQYNSSLYKIYNLYDVKNSLIWIINDSLTYKNYIISKNHYYYIAFCFLLLQFLVCT